MPFANFERLANDSSWNILSSTHRNSGALLQLISYQDLFPECSVWRGGQMSYISLLLLWLMLLCSSTVVEIIHSPTRFSHCWGTSQANHINPPPLIGWPNHVSRSRMAGWVIRLWQAFYMKMLNSNQHPSLTYGDTVGFHFYCSKCDAVRHILNFMPIPLQKKCQQKLIIIMIRHEKRYIKLTCFIYVQHYNT